MTRITIYNEYVHELEYEDIRKVYPEGIHGCIAGFLKENPSYEIRTATFAMPEHGLSEEVLSHTDVLIYWSHARQEEFSDKVADRIREHVLRGMGLIALHSAHYSKPVKKLLGTSMTLRWRHGDRERLFVTAPSHPIAAGLPAYIELPREEMYGEYFDIPKPDDVIFTGWFAGGEVFRSGCTFTRGYGKIFYFQPGHEEYPIYDMPQIQQILKNAIAWCTPVTRKEADLDCQEVITPLEKSSMKISTFYNHILQAGEQTKESIPALLEQAKVYGIQGLEIHYGDLVRDKEWLMPLLGQLQMEISCIFETYDFMHTEDAALAYAQIDLAKQCGAGRVLIIPGFLELDEIEPLHRLHTSKEDTFAWMEQNESIQKSVHALQQLVAYANTKGVMVTLEDYDDNKAPYSRMYQLLYYMEKVPGLCYTLDMGNFAYADEDVARAYEVLQNFIVHVHCKDRGTEPDGNPDWQYRKGLATVPTGGGYLPVAPLIRRLKEDDYKGYLAIEHFDAPDQTAFLEQSASFLREFL